jgi:hypothetical protein
MKKLLTLAFLVCSFPAFSQCEILNRPYPDGTMLYYMEPVTFYWTAAKALKGCVVTDKENYFLELQPVPFPEKPAGNKLKKDLVVKLSNGKSYNLGHYDTRYVDNDTVMEILYLINPKELSDFQNFEITQASINMMGKEGVRTYVFKLHKAALKEQLECFLKEQDSKKKK